MCFGWLELHAVATFLKRISQFPLVNILQTKVEHSFIVLILVRWPRTDNDCGTSPLQVFSPIIIIIIRPISLSLSLSLSLLLLLLCIQYHPIVVPPTDLLSIVSLIKPCVLNWRYHLLFILLNRTYWNIRCYGDLVGYAAKDKWVV